MICKRYTSQYPFVMGKYVIGFNEKTGFSIRKYTLGMLVFAVPVYRDGMKPIFC